MIGALRADKVLLYLQILACGGLQYTRDSTSCPPNSFLLFASLLFVSIWVIVTGYRLKNRVTGWRNTDWTGSGGSVWRHPVAKRPWGLLVTRLTTLLEAPNDEHGWLDTVAVSTALPPKVADSILDRARIFW